MASKPANMHYLANDVPPMAVVIVNALQYVAVTSSFLVFPLIVAREAHLPASAADAMLGWAMLVLAAGTTLQALPAGPIGSGYLAPSSMTAVFLGPSVEAVRIGGIALMSGMTIFSGAVQAGFSRSLNRLRTVLPPELAGVVIFLVGVSNGVVGLRYLLQPVGGGPPDTRHWIVAAITLSAMVAANVWGRGVLGLSCALFGMTAGYAAAIATDVLPLSSLAEVRTLPMLAPPGVEQIGWSFDPALILPFTIAALANGLKAAGLLTASQRLLDADWVRPDLKPIGRGVLADGIGVALGGLLSVFAVNVSASSVGLTAATGVASRRVAYVTSLFFVMLAFLPIVTRLLVLMPGPVVGATLVFTSCAVLKNGIEAIAARIYDTRKTLVVGLSIMAGLGVEAFPAAFREMPVWLHPVTVSSLVFGTAVGFVLNLCFRVGQRRRMSMAIDPAVPDSNALERFIERCGASFGARRDVVIHAEWAAQELVGAVSESCNPRGPMTLSVLFDEFSLDLDLRYEGDAFPVVKEKPSIDEMVEDDSGLRRMSSYLLGRRARRLTTSRDRDVCKVELRFDN
jgi:NCS2 family nucleobase:cation symporter-2